MGMKRTIKSVLVTAVVIVVGLGVVGSSSKQATQKTPYYKLPELEKAVIRNEAWREWKLVTDQVDFRLEQSLLYRRRDMARVYKATRDELEGIRELLNDNRSDATVLREDIQRIDNALNRGR